MSDKLSSSNSLKLSNCEHQWSSVKSASIDTNVKLVDDEAKDRLYEPKHKKKLVHVLTMGAYVFFASLAAIMLSLYYIIFLWKPDDSNKERSSMMYAPDSGRSGCNNGNYLVNIIEPTAIPVVEKNIDERVPTPSTPIAYEESQQGDKETIWPEVLIPLNTTSNNLIRTIAKNSHSSFMRKLFSFA